MLTEDILLSLIKTSQQSNDWSPMIRTLGRVFADPNLLLQCFTRSKEEIHAMEVDQDKDNDSTATVDEPENMETDAVPSTSGFLNNSNLDMAAVKRCFDVLFETEDAPFMSALCNALVRLFDTVAYDMTVSKDLNKDYLNIFIIVLEMPIFQNSGLENILVHFLRAIINLPLKAQVQFCQLWSCDVNSYVKDWLGQLQQLITVRIMTTDWGSSEVNDDGIITGSTGLIRLLYYANVLASKKDSDNIIKREHKLVKELREQDSTEQG